MCKEDILELDHRTLRVISAVVLECTRATPEQQACMQDSTRNLQSYAVHPSVGLVEMLNIFRSVNAIHDVVTELSNISFFRRLRNYSMIKAEIQRLSNKLDDAVALFGVRHSCPLSPISIKSLNRPQLQSHMRSGSWSLELNNVQAKLVAKINDMNRKVDFILETAIARETQYDGEVLSLQYCTMRFAYSL